MVHHPRGRGGENCVLIPPFVAVSLSTSASVSVQPINYDAAAHRQREAGVNCPVRKVPTLISDTEGAPFLSLSLSLVAMVARWQNWMHPIL